MEPQARKNRSTRRESFAIREGMKDFVNPTLLLIVIGLMVYRVVAEAPATSDSLSLILLTVCVTAVMVNGALGLARALTRRPSVKSVLWAGAFFVLGCLAWTMRHVSPIYLGSGEERQAYQDLYQTQRENPLERDSEGENLLTRAAALGEVAVVREIMGYDHLTEADINEAGIRAAEGNKTTVLDELARRGLSAKAVVQGTPLLHAAAQNSAREAMEWLMARGADPNSRDADGMTPLMHAAIAGNQGSVQALLAHGANVRLRDNAGYAAEDYARKEELQTLLKIKDK